MKMPEHFRFSQNNLQDYADCPRRFELKYLIKQEWPAVITEPILEFELHQQLGRAFHTLIQRHLVGIPTEFLEQSLTDPLLFDWWKNYLVFIKQFQVAQCRAEVTNTIPFAGFHLTATFDCLVHGADRSITILDWKTSRFRIPAKMLKTKIQSLVYPYVCYETHKDELSAENIELIYWFPEFPNDPERFTYSQQLHVDSGNFLRELIERILVAKPGGFPLTENVKLCQYCAYRSLCNRGVKAGIITENESTLAEISSQINGLDFNTIEDIQF